MIDKKILVIGDAMLDIYHFGKVDRISPEAPVPVFLESDRKKYVPGGAANVAVNIAAIGIAVELCSVVGSDDIAEMLKVMLAKHNVGISMICENSEIHTTNKLRYIGPNNQQILRVDTEDIVDTPYDLIRKKVKEIIEHIDQYALFLLSDYKKGFLTEEIAQAFINIANSNNIPILVDVKDKNIQKYRNATLVKPNRKELSELTGMCTDAVEDVAAAAEYLCKSISCQYVLTTLGADGMLLVGHKHVKKRVKSVAKEVYDVTGAGDTSIAYLAAELVLGKNILEAMESANYAAGLQVSKVGTSIVYPEEVAAAMGYGGIGEKDIRLNLEWEEILSRLKKKQQKGNKIVFTNGCFDILHVGHVTYLKEAKRLGDILVVGVNTDESVKQLKGNDRPFNPLKDRLLLLLALECVDYVVPFSEETPLNLIKKIEPDVLVKGGDYQEEEIVGAKEVIEKGGIVRSLALVEGKSTTRVIEEIQRGGYI
jgi:D-beta-D-heptose 7-phosphate kinase/D-beta-D-heptose 1-phosphate adenosyltransferase